VYGKSHILRQDAVDEVCGERLSEKVVWQFLRRYAEAAGVPGIAPHDARRTCAKLCRVAGGELEQIQLLLGHASVQTTERYLGTVQQQMPREFGVLRGTISIANESLI
jgi:integrase